MPADWNPASVAADYDWVPALFRQMRDMEDRLRALEQAPQTYLQPGTVTAYSGGNSCTVTFESGEILQNVRLMNGYTPTTAPPDEVAVLFSAYQTIVVGKLRP